jgi:hypothetical protein
MTKTIKLLDMAKLTSGLTMMNKDEYAVKVQDKVFVKTLGLEGEGYYPVVFEKDIVHRIKMLLHGANTDSERALLMFLAYDLGFEDELKKELGG